MSTRFFPGNIYHLYNRGNNRQLIFLEPENYRFFLSRLTYYFVNAGVDLLAYCLMPNHYHLLVRLHNEGDFSNVLRSLSSSYVKSFNRWHARVGHVFQENTREKIVDDEHFLAHLCRYIHLNPVNAGLVKLPDEWEFTDFREWIDQSAKSTQPNILLRDALFSSGEEYCRFVLDYSAEIRARREVEEQLFGRRQKSVFISR